MRYTVRIVEQVALTKGRNSCLTENAKLVKAVDRVRWSAWFCNRAFDNKRLKVYVETVGLDEHTFQILHAVSYSYWINEKTMDGSDISEIF